MAKLSRSEIRAKIQSLNTWRRGSEIAPHKPLLILLAIARLSQDRERMSSFTEVEEPLRRLLETYGPARRSYHPELPFWHLQSDKLWEISGEQTLLARAAGKSPSRSILLNGHAEGGFKPEVFIELKSDPQFRDEIVRDILDSYFPESMHHDILNDIGLSLGAHLVQRRQRDPQFAKEVLRSYEYRCAICDYDARIGNAPMGLEAAHIKWHTAGGPDEVTNGIALCCLHHKAFDRGAFTLAPDLTILLAAELNGSSDMARWFYGFNGKSARLPHTDQLRPNATFLEWHRKEIFREPPRGKKIG